MSQHGSAQNLPSSGSLEPKNSSLNSSLLVFCCLYNYFGGSIINQHHWLNDLYKKKEKKEQSSETFLRPFLTTWQRKCNNKLIMCKRKKVKKKGKKHWKDPTLGLRHTILWCKSFLLSTHKSVVCSHLWSCTSKEIFVYENVWISVPLHVKKSIKDFVNSKIYQIWLTLIHTNL